jgi:hypothetical protein
MLGDGWYEASCIKLRDHPASYKTRRVCEVRVSVRDNNSNGAGI